MAKKNYSEISGDKIYKHEFEYAGLSTADGRKIFSEWLTVFTLLGEIYHKRYWKRYVDKDNMIYIGLVK